MSEKIVLRHRGAGAIVVAIAEWRSGEAIGANVVAIADAMERSSGCNSGRGEMRLNMNVQCPLIRMAERAVRIEASVLVSLGVVMARLLGGVMWPKGENWIQPDDIAIRKSVKKKTYAASPCIRAAGMGTPSLGSAQ